MRDPNDAWLVRLPDGRVVRAKSTGSVRRNIETGRIPIESWVRRAPEEDWVTLEWAVEFTDLVSQKQKEAAQANAGRDVLAAGSARSTDPRSSNELQPVGARGLVDELLNALDSTINRRKLILATTGGLLGGGVLAAGRLLEDPAMELYGVPVSWLVAGTALFLIGGLFTALVMQMTFVELSRLRPAHWHEATANLGSLFARVLLSHLLVNGSFLLLIFGLYLLGEWLATENPADAPPLAAAATALTLALEMVLCPLICLTLLLGPIVIVEECSALRALGQWWTLLRRHLSRAVFYEALAAALGMVLTLPFVVPVILGGSFALGTSRFPELATETIFLLAGLALAPLAAYVTVANVFIYLHLRYEVGPRR